MHKTFRRAKYLSVLNERRNLLMEEMKLHSEGEVESPVPGMSINDMRDLAQYKRSPEFRDSVEKYAQYFSRLRDLEETLAATNRTIVRLNYEHFSSESGTISEMTCGPPSTVSADENFKDMGGDVKEDAMLGSPMESSILSRTDLDIADFLSRPVLISTNTWTLNSFFDLLIDPWTAFLSKPSVRAKLRNNAYLFGNLHIRVSMSGTPFHYGKLLGAYIPQATGNDVSNYYAGHMTTNRNRTNSYLSQVDGAMCMDPKDNVPTEFHCPFISFKRAIRLFNNATTALSDASSFDDAVGLGRFFLSSLNTLKSVTTTPSNVSIFVYAWMTEVQMGPTTGTIITITTESGDEREKGPVEKVTTAMATVSGALSRVPVIGPYARASQMVLSGLANMASLFGWSSPAIIVRPNRIKNEPYQNEANVISFSTAQRLSLDPKQEISVDPRVCGTSADDMSIAAICARNSLLDIAVWNNDSASMTPIWRTVVHPRVCFAYSNAGWYVQPTALYFAATPFQFWRGSITYRVEVVCSAFHRGKLGVLWEPNVSQLDLIEGTLSINKQYLHVMDIQETQTCEFTVEWGLPRDWAKMTTTVESIQGVGSLLTSPQSFFDKANGALVLFPITKLQSPDDSDISVNVYVRSDDMRFNQPFRTNLPLNLTTESGVMASYDVGTCTLNPSHSDMKTCETMCFGEQPLSFRSLLKRFHISNFLSLGVSSGGAAWAYATSNTIPLLTPTIASPVATSTTLMSYLRYAYLGMKGTFRKRVRVIGGNAVGNMEHTHVTLLTPSSSVLVPALSLVTTGPVSPSVDGTLEFVASTNGGVEFDIPLFTNNLYVLSGTNTPFNVSDSNLDQTATRGYYVEHEFYRGSTTLYFIEETAAGEDFTLMRWIAAPPFFTAAF